MKLNVLWKRTSLSLPKESQLNKQSNLIVGTGSEDRLIILFWENIAFLKEQMNKKDKVIDS